MISMNKERRITLYKSNNIFRKIKSFFEKIFSRFKHQENVNIKTETVFERKRFKEDKEIKQDEEKLLILKIQEDYKNDIIDEEDISKEDYKKLLELYDEQNQKINEEIERDKIEIKNMLEKLKKHNSIYN